MLEDYKIVEPTEKLDIQIEKDIVRVLQQMSEHTRIGIAEIVSTAIKRFISQHKDFLPPKI